MRPGGGIAADSGAAADSGVVADSGVTADDGLMAVVVDAHASGGQVLCPALPFCAVSTLGRGYPAPSSCFASDSVSEFSLFSSSSRKLSRPVSGMTPCVDCAALIFFAISSRHSVWALPL